MLTAVRTHASSSSSRHVHDPKAEEAIRVNDPLDDSDATQCGSRTKADPERFWRDRYEFFEHKGYRIPRRSQLGTSASTIPRETSLFPVGHHICNHILNGV